MPRYGGYHPSREEKPSKADIEKSTRLLGVVYDRFPIEGAVLRDWHNELRLAVEALSMRRDHLDVALGLKRLHDAIDARLRGEK